ncbi:penicillin acylase family protein [Piscinibacter sakaiensis]|uniref:Acyl-homoserine lactone acylase PvdQ n=1 Tax=Piscinibacter sakaiensis TaxID=1547922 RepID=A0A0K8P0G8_PISS1|nr:penicillin acylase family protein [Piscinibacter sakaiensis]GAP36128.1 acyl-homoserine lactone acylase PvdQ [Piscinibacter sakaiensis]
MAPTPTFPRPRHRALAPAAATALLLLTACGGGNDGEATAPAPQFSAEIRRTAMGIPHVKAADMAGLGYGYGYAQAEDNLCTMADSFLTYRGERSRWFGPDALLLASSTIGRPANLDADFFHRHVLNDTAVAAFAAAQSADVQQLIDGFVAGYNRLVREVKAGGQAGRHAACRNEAWVAPIVRGDLYRRLYQSNFAGGYSNFLPNIANAQPPATASTPDTVASARDARPTRRQAREIGRAFAALDLQVGGKEGVGSNMYGFGSDASDVPLLFGNPHWYWRGPDRFYQAQLTIPGRFDVSGTSFLGVPMILIGFNNDVAWSHTVSTARRFGFFQLTLAAGDSKAYMKDGVKVPMKATPISVEVRQADGSLRTVTRTLYASEHGPLVNLALLNPALAWSSTTAFAIRDINAENYRTFRTWLRWAQAKSLDEFAAIQREEASIPWVNTVAVGRGSARAWYADIGAMPNVTPAQVASCTTPFGAALAAALPRVPFFDGSRAACDWVDDADSKQRGAIGPARMPSLLRSDWVANMNDSYWLANPLQPLTGFPDIVGPTGSTQSLRTRLGHLKVQQRLAGSDGNAGTRVDATLLRSLVLDNRVLSAELTREAALPVVCASPSIALAADALTGTSFNPPVSVDVSAACSTLQAWNGRGEPTARGTHVWDEFWNRVSRLPAAQLWTTPFNPADPINTPRGLRTDNPAALQQAFAAAVYRVQQSGFAVDATRSEVLFATRNGNRIGLYGGCGSSGYFTIACSENRIEQGGYSMDANPNGNSYMQVVSFPAGGVQAHTFLTFSQSDDPASPNHADYTRRYAAKDWLRVPYTEAEIAADAALRKVSISE